jgi:hypothetical protein
MKIKKGDEFLFNLKLGGYWVLIVTKVSGNMIWAKCVAASNPSDLDNESLAYNKGWFSSDNGALVTKINHHRTKLGKIFYK